MDFAVDRKRLERPVHCIHIDSALLEVVVAAVHNLEPMIVVDHIVQHEELVEFALALVDQSMVPYFRNFASGIVDEITIVAVGVTGVVAVVVQTD